jgi:hypothetical protein
VNNWTYSGIKETTTNSKDTQASTAKKNPKPKTIYSNWDGSLRVPATFSLLAGVDRRAAWVPENARRKRVVPVNSALVATKWFRAYSVSVQLIQNILKFAQGCAADLIRNPVEKGKMV